jgi:hypothetical protein
MPGGTCKRVKSWDLWQPEQAAKKNKNQNCEMNKKISINHQDRLS